MKHRLFSFVILLAALAHPTLSRAYVFSAVAPSGQTLYYNIYGGEAYVTYQYSPSSYSSSSNYYNLTGSLTIPSSVTHAGTTYSVTAIEAYALRYCSGLTSVTIPNSVTDIGDRAFYCCSGLTSVTIPNSVTSIGNSAFSYCSGLTSVTIPNSVTYIGDYAFYSCSGLPSVTIPNSVTSIGDYAFYGCSGLTSVTIPNSVTSIGNYAFNYCSGLTTVNFNADSCTYVGSSSFNSAFYGCNIITTFTFGVNVKIIPAYLCYGMSGLTSVTIPNSVTSIGDYAFCNCTGLDTVYLMPPLPPTLGSYVFSAYTTYNFYSYSTNEVFILSDCSYYYTYYAAWTNYRSQLRDPIINIDFHVTPDYTDRGSTSIIPQRGSDVRCDSSVVVYASPCYGYHFSHWSNGSTANPDMLYLTGDSTVMAYFIGLTATTSDESQGTATHHKIGDKWEIISATPHYGYHFSHWSNGSTANPDTLHLTGDSTVTAYFERNTYTVSTFSNDDALGYACGDVEGLYLDTIELSATCTAEHYHFSRWSDGNTDNPRRYVVEGNRTLTALFAIDTHTVRVTCDVARGTVSGGGRFTYGSACTVEAQEPYTGFVFHSWSNGVTANPYVFAVISDIELSAIFVAEGEEVYTVTVASADPEMGFVGGGGQALAGGRLTIRAQGYPGYRFLRWNDNNTDSVRTVTVTADRTYTAYFAETVGIEDVEGYDQSGPRLYPNPAHSSVTVTGLEPGRRIALVNLYGRTLADLRATSTELTIDVSALSPGTYFVRVEGLPARKVVVIN